jgi:hypothetical protein
MAIATYSDLKTKAASWLRRAGNATYVAEVPDFVTLAEARLNREIGAVETDASRTGTVDSRSISISALSIVEPIALWVADPGEENEREVQKQAASSMAYVDSSGRPSQWCMDSTTNLKLDRPCDLAYAFRFRFRERFALSDSVTTNWLLTNHPDVYLAATLMWGAGYLESWPNGSVFKGMLDEGLASVQRTLSRQKRGTARVDPALVRIGRRSYDDLVNNG